MRLVAAGTRMPAWVREGFDDYARRLPRECSLSLTEIPLGHRAKGSGAARARRTEADRMLAGLREAERTWALEVDGTGLSTERLALRLQDCLDDGRDMAFLVGGPDGLDPTCLARAEFRWSLSPLTLPHGLVRVVVAEQLYRAWTVLRNHPYHRG